MQVSSCWVRGLAILAGALMGVSGLAHASGDASRANPDSSVRSLQRSDALLDFGDSYVLAQRKQRLLRRSDEIVVRLRSGRRDEVVLTRLGTGPLSGFVENRDFGGGLFSFSNPSLRNANAQARLSTYSRLEQVAEEIGRDAAVAWTAPVFVNAEHGTYAVATDEVIVRLRDGTDPARVLRGDAILDWRQAPGLDAFLVRAKAGPGVAALRLANDLAARRDVLWAEPNLYQERQRMGTPAPPNDPLLANQWHLNNTGQGGGTPGADAKVLQAWSLAGLPSAGANVLIAVVDDGIELAHPDLDIYINPGETPGNGIDDDGNGYIDDVSGWDFTSNSPGDADAGASSDDDEHGTAVAGVAAGRGNNAQGIAGASFQAKVLPVRIFNGAIPASDAAIAAALAYASGRARTAGDTNWRGAEIVNNSWGGGPESSAIIEALSWATENGREGRGTIHMFATGNGGTGFISQPAALAGVIGSVIAVGASNNFDVRSSYSQYGPQIDFLAPSNGGSVAIYTTDRLGAPGYNGIVGNPDYTNGFGGTSSATPLASGIAGLMLATRPELTVDQVRELLRVNADKIGPLTYDANGFNQQYGFGRLNAANTLRSIGAPRVRVLSQGRDVSSGSSLEFAALTGDSTLLEFQVVSAGTEVLSLGAAELVGAPEISISEPFGALSLPLGAGTSVSVAVDTGSPGTYESTLSFATGDAAVANFSLDIVVEVQPVAAGGRVFEDWNGNGIEEAGEPPLAGAVVYLDLDQNGERLPPTIETRPSGSIDLGFGGSPSTITNAISVSGLPTELVDVDVQLDVDHEWVGDVRLRLTAPNGQTLTLADRTGGSNNDGVNYTDTIFDDEAELAIGEGVPPYTGRFRPVEALSAFDGIDPNGSWTLTVIDTFPAFDDGVLRNWSLLLSVGGEPVRVTSAAGEYRFVDLAPGDYRVRLDAPDWKTSSPVGGFHSASVAQGNDVNLGLDFAAFRRGHVYGKVFEDLDADGVLGPAEPGIAGQLVFRDRNGNQTLDPIESTNQTRSPNLAIPDGNGTSVSDTLELQGSNRIAKVTVGLGIEHSYVEDLRIVLTAPNGQSVTLIDRRGGDGINFTGTVLDDDAAESIADITAGGAPFSGRFRPEQPLSLLADGPVAGTWTLSLTDSISPDPGILRNWTLTIESRPDSTALSDASGNYRFTLGAGEHLVGVAPDLAWTANDDASYSFTLQAGESALSRDFALTERVELFSNGFED